MMLDEMQLREYPLNIDSFDVTQTILLLGVAETFDMSSRGRSTITVENRWFILCQSQWEQAVSQKVNSAKINESFTTGEFSQTLEPLSMDSAESWLDILVLDYVSSKDFPASLCTSELCKECYIKLQLYIVYSCILKKGNGDEQWVMVTEAYYESSSGSRGSLSGHGPIQFGYRLWPLSNEEINVRYCIVLYLSISIALLTAWGTGNISNWHLPAECLDPPHDVAP